MCNMSNINYLADAPGSPEAFRRAFRRNEWGAGGGVSGDSNTHTSWDDILGGWGADEQWNTLPGAIGDSAGNRRVGRGVGLAFGAYAAGGAAGAGEAGATEVGAGLPLAEEAGGASTGLIGEGTALGEGAAGTAGAAGEQVAPEVVADAASPSEVATTPQDVIQEPAAQNTGDVTGSQNMGPNEGPQQPDKGIFTGIKDWINAKPINTLITGQAISGAASGAMNATAQTRAEKAKRAQQERDIAAQQELKDYPRRIKQGNPSVGGGGVNINLRRGSDGVLRRPDGTPVYAPGGIINRNIGMTGVRG